MTLAKSYAMIWASIAARRGNFLCAVWNSSEEWFYINFKCYSDPLFSNEYGIDNYYISWLVLQNSFLRLDFAFGFSVFKFFPCLLPISIVQFSLFLKKYMNPCSNLNNKYRKNYFFFLFSRLGLGCGNDGGKWITKEHLASFSELKIEWLSNKTFN